MSVGDMLESIALIVVLSSLAVGFWESSQNFGELTSVLDSVVADPTRSGLGLVIFTVSLDVWTPGLPVSMLPSWLQWIGWFYPFAEGYIPHFSIWVCAFALIFSAVITLATLRFTEWSFWGKGLLVAVLAFVVGWYVCQLIAWWGIGFGADLLGLGSTEAYGIWRSAVSATQTPFLQYFFLGTIPLSIVLIYRKMGGYLF